MGNSRQYGRYVLSAGKDLYLWDMTTGQLIHTFTGLVFHSYTVAISPDGRRGLAVSGWSIVVLDLENRKVVRFLLEKSRKMPMTLAYSRDGRRALAGGSDNTVRLVDLEADQELCTFAGHKVNAKSAAFLPGERRAISAADDGSIWIWDVETGKEVYCFPDQIGQGEAFALSSNGKWILFGTRDHKVRLQPLPSSL